MARTFICQGCGTIVRALHGTKIKCGCGVTSAVEIVTDKSEQEALTALHDAERFREALGCISRMKVFPDAEINMVTLCAAIEMARRSLGLAP